jgi:hypothetical protein
MDQQETLPETHGPSIHDKLTPYERFTINNETKRMCERIDQITDLLCCGFPENTGFEDSGIVLLGPVSLEEADLPPFVKDFLRDEQNSDPSGRLAIGAHRSDFDGHALSICIVDEKGHWKSWISVFANAESKEVQVAAGMPEQAEDSFAV